MHNVVDELKGLSAEAAREKLFSKRTELVNVCMNLTNDFNKASVLRAGNAFLAKEIYFVGNKKTDRRGMTGLHHLEVVRHADTLEELVEHLHSEGYTVYAVDNTPSLNPKSVYAVKLPEKSAFVYGEEQRGLTAEETALCDGALYIPQRGAVRSLNIAQAAAVMMSEYTRQHRV